MGWRVVRPSTNTIATSSQKLHIRVRWNFTATFMTRDVPKIVHGIKKTLHKYLLSSPLDILWVIHAHQWLSGYLIQPLPGEHPGVLGYPATTLGYCPYFYTEIVSPQSPSLKFFVGSSLSLFVSKRLSQYSGVFRSWHSLKWRFYHVSWNK